MSSQILPWLQTRGESLYPCKLLTQSRIYTHVSEFSLDRPRGTLLECDPVPKRAHW